VSSRRPPGYRPEDHPAFAVTVDLVALTVRDDDLHVLLVTRGEEPYRGRLALPGGFVQIDEDLPDAAVRELAEETRVRRVSGHLEQLGTYGSPKRDPRMRVVSVAYLALAPELPDPVAGSDASAARWIPAQGATSSRLAFDHAKILSDGIERARAKLEYTSLATAFCPPTFTVSHLRRVYEAVWGVGLDPRNFHRKVTGTAGLLEDTGTAIAEGPGRPATLYRAGTATTLTPPLTRERLGPPTNSTGPEARG